MLSKRDFPQILKAVFNEAEQALAVTGTLVPGGAALPVIQENSLITSQYDEIDLSYYASGANIGQLETVTYKLAGSTVNTLTLSYDGSNNLTSVVKT